MKLNAEMITGPMASPSRPSVRFTPLDMPTMTIRPRPKYSATGSSSGTRP